ncbi:TraB/GumN family protein [Methanosphaera sp.]
MTNENINTEILKRIFIKPPIVRLPKNNSTVSDEESIDNTDEIIEPVHEPSLEIIGTAHISDKSVDTVREVIHDKKPEIVAIELDAGRFQNLIDEMNGIKREQNFDLKKILKSSNLTVTLVSLFLSNMQKRMGEEVGVKPGSEMLEAYKIAREVNADIALIDRNIQTTFKRTLDGMSFREKLSFVWEIIKSYLISDEEEEELFKEEVEHLKQDDVIVEVMEYFKETSPGGYNALVHERDAYMAYNLKSLEDKNVVAVVGAGHKNGILDYLKKPDTIPPIESINVVKESKISFMKVILYLIPVLFIVMFIGAFMQGINIQGGIINYLIFACGGAFIGSLLSGSKIQSALVGMLVAPITIIHPLLAAGWFSGIVEGKLRHVGVHDLTELSNFESFKDLWNNSLFRVILVVLGTNIGCTVGFLLTLNNVFLPYVNMIFGI